MFQSTLPHGERLVKSVIRQSSKPVSIHAPARGATRATVNNKNKREGFQSTLPHGERLRVKLFKVTIRCFNPRSRTGSDMCKLLILLQATMFQSTLPHGERHHYSRGQPDSKRFNPRSRTGSDARNLRVPRTYPVSIHAPARGATYYLMLYCQVDMFQSTLPHGERHGFGQVFFKHSQFQSTLPHGERRRTRCWQTRIVCFNPRSRTGSDVRIFETVQP